MNWLPLILFFARWAPTIEQQLAEPAKPGEPDYITIADTYFDAIVPVMVQQDVKVAPFLHDLQNTIHQVLGKQ